MDGCNVFHIHLLESSLKARNRPIQKFKYIFMDLSEQAGFPFVVVLPCNCNHPMLALQSFAKPFHGVIARQLILSRCYNGNGDLIKNFAAVFKQMDITYPYAVAGLDMGFKLAYYAVFKPVDKEVAVYLIKNRVPEVDERRVCNYGPDSFEFLAIRLRMNVIFVEAESCGGPHASAP